MRLSRGDVVESKGLGGGPAWIGLGEAVMWAKMSLI